ncbi:conserved fungal cell wall protein, Kre9/Knh1 family Knh1 [Schizosaccharomyces osmophilus]|uniref:Conserved fungal cell wall protein, Kre9/Knh1 family Knh1 n=1 Tax=Schizosaccharomyces osmophilus TaxID=2545709 RepID=A0AAE9WBQ4_9SCHI|nr:conserved fungal cell wall protein, Kre9/Knh1 family Knh1 [Schizosaccharomyces osmophilus]WBW72297.1 conserved fungal cell wall protein, Kre9/Knh1 family Knh1 [Schizosaccharomyces osmophilus]
MVTKTVPLQFLPTCYPSTKPTRRKGSKVKMWWVYCLLVWYSIIQCAFAQIRFTQPSTTDSFSYDAITIKWAESNFGVSLKDIENTKFQICTNSADQPKYCYMVPEAVKPSSTGSYGPFSMPVSQGRPGRVWFIWAQSTTTNGKTINDYSDFFTITGLTGTFDGNVFQTLMQLGVWSNTPVQPEFTLSWPTGTMRDWYLKQTGRIRTGPMQQRPGSVFTAQTTSFSRLWETSSYSVFTKYGSMPYPTSTVQPGPSYTYTLYANYASTASSPVVTATPTYGLRRRDLWSRDEVMEYEKRRMRIDEPRRGLFHP